MIQLETAKVIENAGTRLLLGLKLVSDVSPSAERLEQIGVIERYDRVGYLLEEYGDIPYTDPNKYTANVS